MDATTQSGQLAPALPLKQLRPGAITVLHGLLTGDLAPDQTARLTCTEFADLLAMGKYGVDDTALTKEQKTLWKAWQAGQAVPDPQDKEAAWRAKAIAGFAAQAAERAKQDRATHRARLTAARAAAKAAGQPVPRDLVEAEAALAQEDASAGDTAPEAAATGAPETAKEGPAT